MNLIHLKTSQFQLAAGCRRGSVASQPEIDQMAYRLPPLNTMRLFEAAGRLGSFKAAAEELHVTPSAVSHGIQSLEDWLGVALFTRGNRSLALTPAGAAYLPQVRQALDLLVRAGVNLPGQMIARRLAISVAPSFGLLWLVPHLPRFQERHPGLEVMIDTDHQQVSFPRAGVDLAIRMGRGDWPDVTAIPLITEQLVPLCTPESANRLREPSDLARATLLRVTDVSEDWSTWFDLAGLPPQSGAGAHTFDTIHMARQAALQGLGVMIGRLPLMADDVACGRLVPLFGPPRACATGYWLVAPPEALSQPAARAFQRWIEDDLRRDLRAALA
jgi:DNA-binding transcriptional LysR family regulator